MLMLFSKSGGGGVELLKKPFSSFHSFLTIFSVLLLSVFLLTGCGGGGSGDSGTGASIKTISGKVIKKETQSATVCADKNGDNKCNEGDIFASVNQDTGEYTINLTQADFMTKPLIAVITDKPTQQQQSRMFFWVKEAIAADTNTPIVFTTPLERTTISSLTTKVASELDKNPLDSADYQAKKLKETTGLKDTIADLFDATNDKVIEIANSDTQINKVNGLPKNEEASKIQTAAEALAGIDGYMMAGGEQCGPSSTATCWIRYNFGASSFMSINDVKKIDINNQKYDSIKVGIPDGNAKPNPFSYASHSDGTVTVSGFKFGGKVGSLKTIGFDVLTVETVNIKELKANIKYDCEYSSPVTGFPNDAEMYILKSHAPEEAFTLADDTIKEDFKKQNGDNTKKCGSEFRCDSGSLEDKEQDKVFTGNDFQIVMYSDKDYIVNHLTEDIYFSGNMGPAAKKREFRRGKWADAGKDSYIFYGEGGVPVFKIVKGDNNKYIAAGHMALANYDSFTFFNKAAAEKIYDVWKDAKGCQEGSNSSASSN